MVLLHQEQRREEGQDEERRRSQAVKVSAWLEPRRDAHGKSELAFQVHNASEMPIYEVSLSNPIPDGNEDSEAGFIGLAPPGQTIHRAAPLKWATSYFSPEPVPVEFLDGSGRL
jgi:hypothetical protein